MSIIDRKHCLQAKEELNEHNDCVVRACAVATNTPYRDMHQYLKDQCGREQGTGLHSYQYHAALEALGYKLTKLEGPKYEYNSHLTEGCERYYRSSGTWAWVDPHWVTRRKKVGPGKDYNAATVRTLVKEMLPGTYLIGTSGHVACMKDGEVHDFTKNRRHRIRDIYRVEKKT